jgi:O-antigen/teichoic acid export membrane protein
MIVMALNFGFKIYLAKHFSQINLITYYTILDMFTLITRIFAGYKDALTTTFYTSVKKLHVLRLFTTLFIYVVSFIALIIIPLGVVFYLEPKIEEFSLSWISISLLFVLMNTVAYFGYLFLVYKEYKFISLYDMLKSILVIFFILIFYILFSYEATYKTLIYATTISYGTLLVYLVYKRKKILKRLSFKRLFSFKLPKFQDDTKKRFIYLTFMASSKYFIYGLLLFAPVFVMLHFQKLEELADFQVVSRSIYFALVAIFSWPLGRFMFVEFASLIDKRDFKELKRVKVKFLKVLSFFSIILFTLTWLYSKSIISFIFPYEYHKSYEMLNILIVALPFVMYTNYSESVIKVFGRYQTNLLINIFGVFIFVFSYFLFDFKYASIYAFVMSMIGIFLISYIIERKLLQQEAQK